ncbi:MAG: hypothetical protein ACI4SZ_02720 [Lachnospiraceae bacterium]
MGVGVIPIHVESAETVMTARNGPDADASVRRHARNGPDADASVRRHAKNGLDAILRGRSRDSRLGMHANVNNRKQRISVWQTAYSPHGLFSMGRKNIASRGARWYT